MKVRLRTVFATLGMLAAMALAVSRVWAQSGTTKRAGQTPDESAPPQWPPLAKPAPGAPNVLVVLTDDVGFGASSTYGGPVPTPTLDRLAKQGIRYSQFNNTAMCSPSRAAMLTGRNATRVGMGAVTDRATGYEGYTTVIPPSAGTVAEILRQRGYSTAAFGKWHLTPLWEMGPNGPFDHWPTRMGFDHFFGFLTGDTDQWAPTLYRDLSPVEPPANDPTFIHDKAIADDAISWLHQRKSTAPDKPLFLYLATGAAHAPHQAPREWLLKFRGQFHDGWDRLRDTTFARQLASGIVPAGMKLTPRPAELPAWSSLSADQKAVYEREMEAFAASLAFGDYQVGRIVDDLQATGQLDNTLIIYMQGDNGGSGEGGLTGAFNENSVLNGLVEDITRVRRRLDDFGGPLAHSNFPAGWGWATNTPFQWMKQIGSHWGGARSGMVISWPARIRAVGGVRTQFHHMVDITPTILAAARIDAPARLNGVDQLSMDGIDMSYTFDNAAAPSRRTLQFFTMWDNMAIYKDGWVAATRPHVFPWELVSTAPGVVNGRTWELYNVAQDFSEANDVSAQNPEKLKELQAVYWAEAERNNALPIHRGEGGDGKPSWVAGQTTFTFQAGVTRLPSAAAPATVNRSFTIQADVTIPPSGARGVLATHGGRGGGWGLYLLEGKLVFAYNYADIARYAVVSKSGIGAGTHIIEARFDYDGGGTGRGATVTLLADGKAIGSGRIEKTLPRFFGLDAMFDVGLDTGSPISEDYRVPFAFSGLLKKLVITLR